MVNPLWLALWLSFQCFGLNGFDSGNSEFVGENWSIIPSHGGEVKTVAIHALPAGELCNTHPVSGKLKSSLHKVFGSDKVCLNSHIVVPNWTPAATGGLEGLFKGTNVLSCLDGCELRTMFAASLGSQQVYKSVYDEYNSILSASNESIGLDDRKTQLLQQLGIAYEELKNQLTEDFESNFGGDIQDSGFSGCEINGSVRRSFQNRLCRQLNLSFCDCVSEYRDNLVDYLQDYFLVAESGSDRKLLRSWTYYPENKQSLKLHSDYLIQQCACGIKSSEESKVNFQGGNILVSEKFALVGKDILIRYLQSSPYSDIEGSRVASLQALGLSGGLEGLTDDNSNMVYDAIRRELFSNKKVLLVGLENRGFDNGNVGSSARTYRSFQPNYHLDLSFSLIGETGEQEFTFLVARPDPKYLKKEQQQDQGILNFLSDYNEKLDTVAASITEFLVNECGYGRVVFVDVPMLASVVPYNSGRDLVFQDHYSFVNGVSFKDSSGFQFAYADFMNRTPDGYIESKEEFEKKLRDNVIEPLPVQYDFVTSGRNYGIRCVSKVLNRQSLP